MIWSSILVPYDFSPSAEHAAALACDHAAMRGGRLTLLHVVELVPHFGPDTLMLVPPGSTTPISARRHFIETAQADLTAVAEPFVSRGINTTIAVRAGIPVDEILEYASEHAITAIAMGTHGRTGLRRVIFGSVAARIIQRSTVPVLTIRHPEDVPSLAR